MTLNELNADYGNTWELYELRWDVAACRRKPITQSMYEAGFLQVLLARDLDALAERLAQQTALETPELVLNGVLFPPNDDKALLSGRFRQPALPAPPRRR